MYTGVVAMIGKKRMGIQNLLSLHFHQALCLITGADIDKLLVSYSAPFTFPARKQLPKRTIQDTLEEQNEDKTKTAKKRKKEEGEGAGCLCV